MSDDQFAKFTKQLDECFELLTQHIDFNERQANEQFAAIRADIAAVHDKLDAKIDRMHDKLGAKIGQVYNILDGMAGDIDDIKTELTAYNAQLTRHEQQRSSRTIRACGCDTSSRYAALRPETPGVLGL